VFLRLDDNSAVKMVSPDLTLTKSTSKRAALALKWTRSTTRTICRLIDAGVITRLDKKGYYEFDAEQPVVMVFKGEAKTEVADGLWRKIKGHHELMLTGGTDGQSLEKEKPAEFDSNAPDDLYKWSSLRSQYLAEANNQIAGQYAAAGYVPGWYWNPYGFGYTFIGAGPFYSPFGYGFYPFGWGGLYGGWYGGYAHPWYGYRVYRNGGIPRGHVIGSPRVEHSYRCGAVSGFQPNVVGFHGPTGGGFHGGAMGSRR
jgi:hypothetical protein